MRFGAWVCCWFLCFWVGWSQDRAVHIEIANRGLVLSPAPIRDGEECWFPIVHAPKIGFPLELIEKAQFARLVLSPPVAEELVAPIGDSGRPLPEDRCSPPQKTEVRVPVRVLQLREENGQKVHLPCVPLRQLVQLVGGVSRWDEEYSVLRLDAKLQQVHLQGDLLLIQTTLPVQSIVRLLKEPDRLVVDLLGCQLETLQPVGTHPQVQGIRLGQFDPHTVRIVCDLKTPLPVAEGIATFGTEHRLALAPEATPEGAAAQPEVQNHDTIRPPIIERSEQGMLVRLPTQRAVQPRLSFLENPLRVVLDLPNERLGELIEQTFREPEVLLLKAIRIASHEGPQGKFVRVVLELGRALGVQVHSHATELAISLHIPRGAGGKLREKIITIDPGHGGSQSGARITQKGKTYYEKEITLAIGLKVAQHLSKAGATVLMTRAEDADLGLYARTQIANQSGAHFFISIHCDSNSKPNSVSGTTVYYHDNDADSRALAQAILNEIVQVSGLPSKGVRSDKSLYPNGLAVLRTSQMPAVLIEVGYLNHDTDRAKLLNPKFQSAIAEAIVRGLRKYVEQEGSVEE